MENVTQNMLRFKEAVRHVWNTYLLDATDFPMSPDIQESFEIIERELIRVLVLLPIGMANLANDYRRVPLPINLYPKNDLVEIPVQFGSVDQNRNVKWELPSYISAADMMQYRYIEFFDWSPFGHIDLNYVKALTPHGQFVLIEQAYCEFKIIA